MHHARIYFLTFLECKHIAEERPARTKEGASAIDSLFLIHFRRTLSSSSRLIDRRRDRLQIQKLLLLHPLQPGGSTVITENGNQVTEKHLIFRPFILASLLHLYLTRLTSSIFSCSSSALLLTSSTPVVLLLFISTLYFISSSLHLLSAPSFLVSCSYLG